jgi:hypothetical protein
MDPPVSPALEELLSRVAPGHVVTGDATLAVVCGGIELPVVVNGASRTMLHVSHTGSTGLSFAPRSLIVLRIVTGQGELRVDLPVEVVNCGRASMVLRLLSSPLVLRRRMVRDRALAEALGVPEPATPLVA